MKILIAAASFSPRISGVQRHAFNVVRCLLQHPDVSDVHLVVAPWQRELTQEAGLDPHSKLTTHVPEMDRSSVGRNLWYYLQLPELAASLQADVVHLSYPMPVDAGSFVCPTVVTLHDLYPYEIPQNFGFPQVIFNRLILQQCLHSVDAIACVSEATNLRLRQYAPPATWQKAVRIYNCVEAPLVCATQTPLPGWQGEPFLLCVAQHRRNKNIPLLIEAFARLLRRRQIDPGMKLVVIGITGRETRRIHRLVSQRGLSQNVHFLEGLSEPELQWCYARCEALVAPSRTEGFGLPVAEALLAGCRVVCSDIPAFREVGEGHCRFVALQNDAEEALAAAIVACIQEAAKAPVSLPQLSAPALAEQYVALYRRLVASATPIQNAQCSLPIYAATPERHSLYERN
jgi:glycosyltransferase involved in cell wall biosynthesis